MKTRSNKKRQPFLASLRKRLLRPKTLKTLFWVLKFAAWAIRIWMAVSGDQEHPDQP